MSELELFNFDGQQMRVVQIGGEPWFVAIDACAMLGLVNVSKAVQGLDDDEAALTTIQGSIQGRETNIISESGLYSLILRSRRPEAKAIRRWVTGTVLPSIRRTGGYGAPTPVRPPTRLELARMVMDAEAEIEAQREVIAELEPHAAFAEGVMSADGDWKVRDAAQMLSRDPAIATGQNRLFGTLRMLGWIDRTGTPIQRFIDRGMLATRVQSYTHPHTEEPTLAKPQVRITGKGLVELHRHLGGQRPLRLSLPLGTPAAMEAAR